VLELFRTRRETSGSIARNRKSGSVQFDLQSIVYGSVQEGIALTGLERVNLRGSKQKHDNMRPLQ
jgi:hypothetical protein